MNNNFILPEKWYIKINDDNREIINNWKIQQSYYNLSLFNNRHYTFVDNDGAGWTNQPFNDSLELTTQQFIDYVLNPIPTQSIINEDLNHLKELLINLNIK